MVACIEFTFCLVCFVGSLTDEPLIIGNMELVTISMTAFLLQGCREYVGYRNHMCVLSEVKAINSLGKLKLYIHILS
jgi:hypothetical protein